MKPIHPQLALDVVLAEARPLAAERIDIASALHRVTAEDLKATLTQPPFPMSAMDGYAVRFSPDLHGATFEVVGEAAAGKPCNSKLAEHETVRVSTGSIIPDGADHVIMQEHVERDSTSIRIQSEQPRARNIRQAGIDFFAGDILVPAGTRLSPYHLAIAAAGNCARVEVRRKPIVSVLANGNELRLPGTPPATGEIISSTHVALSGLIETWGGQAEFLGIAADSPESILEHIHKRQDADVLVCLGGASVGDHDQMTDALLAAGIDLKFEKVSIRPGKPTWFGRLANTSVLGLPGNPASALICAQIYLKPLVEKMTGLKAPSPPIHLPISHELPENAGRETYLLARLIHMPEGHSTISVLNERDTSLLSPFLKATHLLLRPEHAAFAEKGSHHPCFSLV